MFFGLSKNPEGFGKGWRISQSGIKAKVANSQAICAKLDHAFVSDSI
jgi:hypothetical protein